MRVTGALVFLRCALVCAEGKKKTHQLHALECSTARLELLWQYEKHEPRRRTADAIEPIALPLARAK